MTGILFVLITGTLAHFLYGWTGNHIIAGLFTPVNESTWEHMKLVFFPMLLYALLLIPKCRTRCPCIVPALPAGILLGTGLVPVIFYTYTGILGFDFFVLDLLTFGLSVIAGFYTVYRLAGSCRASKYTVLLYAMTAVTALCFALFTCFPPTLGLFREP